MLRGEDGMPGDYSLYYNELDDVLDHVGIGDMVVRHPRQIDHMLAVAAAI